MDKKYLLPIIMALLLGGCGSETADEEKEKVILDDAKAAIDKAKEVEALVSARVDELNKNLEEQEKDAEENDDDN